MPGMTRRLLQVHLLYDVTLTTESGDATSLNREEFAQPRGMRRLFLRLRADRWRGATKNTKEGIQPMNI